MLRPYSHEKHISPVSEIPNPPEKEVKTRQEAAASLTSSHAAASSPSSRSVASDQGQLVCSGTTGIRSPEDGGRHEERIRERNELCCWRCSNRIHEVQLEQQTHEVQLEQQTQEVQLEQQIHLVQLEQQIQEVQLEQQTHEVQLEQQIHEVQLEQQTHEVQLEHR
ncbi:Hypothetical protein SMAX5B_004610 [Scophthalmus maximus]|uniref:Uncharacterized protein n=1 Tax=Scophthalmus maximus TaxID=52904 RepID=A0A2U9BHQ3_SCOMX|nr:Hypothetical protein SMAX5B_004610 [Scophthalmus maximus]